MKATLKSINTFLNTCVDYLDNRILTGKFIGDSIHIFKTSGNFFYKIPKKLFFFITRSTLFAQLTDAFFYFWRLFLKIPLAKTIVSIIIDAIKILITCYSEFFIVFAFTFTSSILLLNFFQTSLVTFFIALIPLLLLDVSFVSALYYCIDRHGAGEHISIWQSLLIVFRHFTSFSFTIIVESAILLETIIIFLIMSLFVRYIFDIFQISWSGSIFFWFAVIFIGSLLFIGIFIVNMVMTQTYFAVLLDHIPFQQALNRGRRLMKTFSPYYVFFYLLLYLFCAVFIWKAFFSYLYLGVTVSLFCTISLSTFLGYLLRKKFHLPPAAYAVNLHANQKTYLYSVILISFGLINYLLIAVLLIKIQQPLFAFIQQQQDNFLASQGMKQYNNNTYGYAVDYPQGWSFYQWTKNSVTFYNNYTGSLTGGTWMTITVSPYNEDTFLQLYQVNPGIVVYNTLSKDITTKVSDLTVQGYNAVNYTYTKPGMQYTQYETHYLIHKNSMLYDIAFISMTNDVANYNSDLFQKIISTFRFTNQ